MLTAADHCCEQMTNEQPSWQSSYQMAEHTLCVLQTLLKKELIAGFVTVSRDPVVRTLTQKFGGVFLPEKIPDDNHHPTHPPSLRPRALRVFRGHGGRSGSDSDTDSDG